MSCKLTPYWIAAILVAAGAPARAQIAETSSGVARLAFGHPGLRDAIPVAAGTSSPLPAGCSSAKMVSSSAATTRASGWRPP